MGKALNLKNQKFGRLTAIKKAGRDKNKNIMWLCKCDCGKEISIVARDLKNGHTKSCGCLQKQKIQDRYGRLSVLKMAYQKSGRKFYLCKCDCGAEVMVMAGNLIQGNTKSCGCLRHDTKPMQTHGLSKNKKGQKTRLFRIWTGIKTRCFNQNDKAFKNYGGREISICEEWLSFEIFHLWAMSNGYKKNLTIERINNDGNYCSGNCKWIPLSEQALNRRTTRKGGN